MKRFSPFLVLALARDTSGHELTYEQISAASGISVRNIARIGKMLDWDNVKSKTVDDFIRGCNFQDARRQVEFMRKTSKSNKNFTHLSPIRRRIFEGCCTEWRALKNTEKQAAQPIN